ncbi:MAG: S41 family peptidase [Roseiflexaceae bacterium]
MQSLLGRVLRARLPFWTFLPMLVMALGIGGAGGYLTAQRTLHPCPLTADQCETFGTFWQAWQRVERNYVDPSVLNAENLTDGAIRGMVESLGDTGHSRYLPPADAQAERESINARFEGIGAYIDVLDGQPIIVEPIENSPAEAAGLLSGDRILKIGDRDVRGLSIDELRPLVRGPRGTQVTFTIQRDGRTESFEVTVTREEIDIPSVTWRMLPDQTAHIQIIQFSATASSGVRQAISEARTQGAQSIVLDLRNNSGGLVDQLVAVASEFLPKGTTLLIERDREGKEVPYTAREGGTALDLPMIVLVNNNSASAAEILAGALGEAGRAKVVGVPTFGTATVLRTFRLDNGGELRLGTTQWLTPQGKQVRGSGITPDIVVELPLGKLPLSPREAAALSPADLANSGDTQLLRALELLHSPTS